MDARERIEELLKPECEIIGVRRRPGSNVRRVAVIAPVKEAREIFERLADLGHEVSVEEPTRGSRPGRLVEIPGVGYVGHRETQTPTIDVNVRIEGLRNVKFKFVPTDGGASA